MVELTKNKIMEQELKVGDVVELEVFGEICCEVCNEIIHNHLDCPVCKKEYASSNQYGDMCYETEIICDECGTEYEKVEGDWYWNCKAKIKSFKNKELT